jgi:hypothetical protein
MTTPATETPAKLLDRVRKLLAKAEDESATPPEAQALTAKAAELMAKYGIDRALLAAQRPETDRPSDRVITLANPWSRVKSHLLSGIASAMRCQCVILTGTKGATRLHLFGYESDLERADVLYTSVLMQMWHGMAAAELPEWTSNPRAWRRSWMLGFASAVITRVKESEAAATQAATQPTAPGAAKAGAALVLADRNLVVQNSMRQAYPRTRTARVTYSGSGYSDGHAKGQRANLGTGQVGGGNRALGR